jgi:hypothetical protein
MPTIPSLNKWVRQKLNRPNCLELAKLPSDINKISLHIERQREDAEPGEVYIIRQPVMGRGMFSLVSSVVCHLHVAQRFNLNPVVDFSGSHPTEYNDSEFEEQDDQLRTNAWDYYFQPVSTLTLEKAVGCNRILSSVRSFPDRYPVTISHVRELRKLTCKMIHPCPEIAREVDRIWQESFKNKLVLGVHSLPPLNNFTQPSTLPLSNKVLIEFLLFPKMPTTSRRSKRVTAQWL